MRKCSKILAFLSDTRKRVLLNECVTEPSHSSEIFYTATQSNENFSKARPFIYPTAVEILALCYTKVIELWRCEGQKWLSALPVDKLHYLSIFFFQASKQIKLD